MQTNHSIEKVEHVKKLIEFIKKFIENYDKFSRKEITSKNLCSNFHMLKKNLTLEKVRKTHNFLEKTSDFRSSIR